jgi:hypothetical protein
MTIRIIPAVALVAGLAVPGSAHATAVCFETNRIRFTPTLTLTATVGTMGIDYQKQCVRTNGTVYSAGATGLSFPYIGNCITAAVGGGTTNLVGGVLNLDLNKVMVMVADSLNPCAFSTGSGYALKID